MADTFANQADRTPPATRHFAITPSNSTDFPILPRAIYCQEAGTAQVVDGGGVALPYAMAAGAILPVRATRINATGTTGTYYGLY